MDLNAILRIGVELGASDIHLKVDQPPMLRTDGAIAPLPECPALSEQNLLTALETVTHVTPDRLRQFHETGDLDLAYTAEGLPRFRVNVFRQRGAISLALRVIPRDVPSFEKLSLPAGVARLAHEHRGLILVTGATGSGKTTTLASMLDHINRTRQSHIVTIEDPIEILHPDRSSIVNQREVGLDTESFGQALRRVLRQDPDVILVGEMRDEETVQTALSAAETGHLVLSTLHTVDASETINRIIDFFPPHQQQQARAMIAGTLKGIVSQRLVPTADGKGRVACCEILVMTGRVHDMILDPKLTGQLPEVVAEGGYYGMQTFDQHLLKHLQAGRITMDDAMRVATSPHDFKLMVAAIGKKDGDTASQPEASVVRESTPAPGAAQPTPPAGPPAVEPPAAPAPAVNAGPPMQVDLAPPAAPSAPPPSAPPPGVRT